MSSPNASDTTPTPATIDADQLPQQAGDNIYVLSRIFDKKRHLGDIAIAFSTYYPSQEPEYTHVLARAVYYAFGPEAGLELELQTEKEGEIRPLNNYKIPSPWNAGPKDILAYNDDGRDVTLRPVSPVDDAEYRRVATALQHLVQVGTERAPRTAAKARKWLMKHQTSGN